MLFSILHSKRKKFGTETGCEDVFDDEQCDTAIRSINVISPYCTIFLLMFQGQLFSFSGEKTEKNRRDNQVTDPIQSNPTQFKPTQQQWWGENCIKTLPLAVHFVFHFLPSFRRNNDEKSKTCESKNNELTICKLNTNLNGLVWTFHCLFYL